jgi:hypothetical protein
MCETSHVVIKGLNRRSQDVSVTDHIGLFVALRIPQRKNHRVSALNTT